MHASHDAAYDLLATVARIKARMLAELAPLDQNPTVKDWECAAELLEWKDRTGNVHPDVGIEINLSAHGKDTSAGLWTQFLYCIVHSNDWEATVDLWIPDCLYGNWDVVPIAKSPRLGTFAELLPELDEFATKLITRALAHDYNQCS